MNRQVCSLCGSKLRIGNLQRSAAPCRSCRRAGIRVVGREITGRSRQPVLSLRAGERLTVSNPGDDVPLRRFTMTVDIHD